MNTFTGTVVAGQHPNDDDAIPKAFVTILFFDRNYNFLDAAWSQMTASGAQTSPTVKQPPHSFLSKTAAASEPGYAYVFVSNEHDKYVDVYFDDVTISQTPSAIVSSSDYMGRMDVTGASQFIGAGAHRDFLRFLCVKIFLPSPLVQN